MCSTSLKSILIIVILTNLFASVSFAQLEIVTAKIHSLQSKPIIKATINGKPAYLLLDTGSDINLLHSKGEKEFKFSSYRRHDGSNNILATVNGIERDFCYVFNIHVSVGVKHIPGCFIWLDIGSIVRSIRIKTGITISGIIGSETMKRLCFMIDYEKEEIAMKGQWE